MMAVASCSSSSRARRRWPYGAATAAGTSSIRSCRDNMALSPQSELCPGSGHWYTCVYGSHLWHHSDGLTMATSTTRILFSSMPRKLLGIQLVLHMNLTIASGLR